jgi:hypothetical protein
MCHLERSLSARLVQCALSRRYRLAILTYQFMLSRPLRVRPKEVASYESVVILMSVVKPDGRARWLGGGG